MDVSSYAIGFAIGLLCGKQIQNPSISKGEVQLQADMLTFLDTHDSFTVNEFLKATASQKGFLRRFKIQSAASKLVVEGKLACETDPGSNLLNRDRTVRFSKTLKA